MLVKWLPWPWAKPFIGLLSLVFVNSNILVCGIAIHAIGLFGWVTGKSSPWSRPKVDIWYRGWVRACEWWFHRVLGVTWQLDESFKPKADQWHLIIANHQTWVDAFVLLAQVQGRVPMPRIFMKDTLGWLPLVGSATKIMGFPHVKRYSKAKLARHPELVGKDLATTQKSCESLMSSPSAVMSFVEGTRFTLAKHKAQQSPYEKLLRPKAGGIFMVLQAMPGRFTRITDVNIVYGDKVVSYWDLLCGRVGPVQVRVRHVPLPVRFQGALSEQDKSEFFEWFNGYWQGKDDSLVADQADCSILEMNRNAPINGENGLQS